MALTEKVGLVHGGGIHAEGAGFALDAGGAARTARAVELLTSGYVDCLIMSGSNGTGRDLPASEAELMADYAMRLGADHRNIEVEAASHSTIGNWANSVPIIMDMDAKRVVGVTGLLAGRRAREIGESIIGQYDLPFEISGYVASGELEGKRAVPRELVSTQMARRCLDAASAQDVMLEDLDAFYMGWKSRTGLASLKAVLSGRNLLSK